MFVKRSDPEKDVELVSRAFNMACSKLDSYIKESEYQPIATAPVSVRHNIMS